jgi:hypothetical protein
MTTEARMNEPSPRGWDDQIVKVAASLAFDQEDAAYHFRRLSEGAAPDSEAWVSRTVLENAEVVPVPDEQAIERGEHEYDRAVARGEDHHKAFRRGLAAALEQPE